MPHHMLASLVPPTPGPGKGLGALALILGSASSAIVMYWNTLGQVMERKSKKTLQCPHTLSLFRAESGNKQDYRTGSLGHGF